MSGQPPEDCSAKMISLDSPPLFEKLSSHIREIPPLRSRSRSLEETQCQNCKYKESDILGWTHVRVSIPSINIFPFISFRARKRHSASVLLPWPLRRIPAAVREQSKACSERNDNLRSAYHTHPLSRLNLESQVMQDLGQVVIISG